MHDRPHIHHASTGRQQAAAQKRERGVVAIADDGCKPPMKQPLIATAVHGGPATVMSAACASRRGCDLVCVCCILSDVL